MSNAVPEHQEALRTLVGMAQDEISDALAAIAEEGSPDFLQLCLSHLENIIWVAEQAGLPLLQAAANALHDKLEREEAGIGAEQGRIFSAWLANVLLHIDAPQQEEPIGVLLAPLDEADQAALLAALDPDHLGGEPHSGDSRPGADDFPDEAIELSAFDEPLPGLDEAAIFEEAAPEFDTGNMLGMLAYELYEISPDLAALTRQIVSSQDDQLNTAVEGYNELVSRVGLVSRELGLNGLVLICDFVSDNLALTAERETAERAPVAEVLQGWTRVVIDHLAQPTDDALCLAVVDFLEKEDWPRPLPYRDVRDLIEGLTQDLEVSGDSEVEAREIEARPDDVSLEMSEDASPELVDAFFAESPGHAETLSHHVEAISRGDDIQSNVEAAQRIAHTLKGSGNLVGVRGIANLAHHIEDIFEYIAKRQITPPSALANTLQEAADCLETMLESLQGISSPPADSQRVLQDVLDWANRVDSGKMRHEDFEAPAADESAEAVNESPEEAAEVVLPPDVEADRRKSADTEKALSATRGEAVRVPLKVLDNIFRIVSETAITIGQIQERLNRLEGNEKMIRKNDASLQQMRYDLENLVSVRGMAARHRSESARGEDGFDPLEMDEYDEFYGATHAYIEGVADSREILRGFSAEVYELNALFLLQQRLNKELQQMVMTTRMVPVSIICPRLQRAVRQACRATGKQAELTIIGQDLLLDGDVLNRLADPLMHMLRNAVDHSIENGELRFDRGKPEAGRITLAFRQEGNNIVVSCGDDGGGLDYERIREVAIRKNLLSEHDPVDQHSLAQLILQSGFSTSQKVTQVSGRGVGMDVVNNTIQSLNGAMEIGDAKEGGTLVSLRLPITLLTSHCLLAGAGKERIFAIPTISLTQILSPGTGKVSRVGDGLTFQLAQDVYTACTLNALVGENEEFVNSHLDNCSVLLVQTVEGVTAVIVERVVTSYDLVVKNMGAYIKSISGIAGVSMLGNGDVVSVLDLSTLLESRRGLGSSPGTRTRSLKSAPAEAEISLPKVLIVDDSLSVRNSLSQLMGDGGYQVLTARDGLEAVNVLEADNPDIVLTDLEMPRMNGLDLVSYIRNSQKWSALPVVMITSRTMAKHRQQAESAGVNCYITKPFTEDEVLASIDEQLTVTS